jgi:acetylglutamate kinase
VKLLVKLGGTLLDAEATRESLARQIAAISRGVSLVVVHGGGRQMTRYLAERGIESQFVNGLRVTTPAILDAVVAVVAGSVNCQLVAALNRAGARAVGLSGVDACLVEAEQMDGSLGSVGRVVAADPALLHLLLGGGFLPVVACVAGDRGGRLYNVNADQMAVACATAFGADLLVFLTDVEGVLDTGKRLAPYLTLPGSESLIAAGAATGGMLAKLNSAQAALRQGVPQVRIAGGASSRILERILAGEDAGTRIAAGEVSSSAEVCSK